MGKLILIGTPIGNMSDVSKRCVEVLSSVDLVAAEDTRHSGMLLHNLGIKKPMISYYKHNEKSRAEEILNALAEGKDVGVISDAGMPGIADPGYDILCQAIEEGYEVSAVPGPCAFVTALVMSGLPTTHFAFEGFLPRDVKGKEQMKKLKNDTRTLIFYESPHRLLDGLELLKETFGGERRGAVCRELTKIYEEVNRGTLDELIELWQDRKVQGEFVLIVEGAKEEEKEEISLTEIKAELDRLMAGGMKHKAAAKEVAYRHDLPVKQVYEMGIEKE